MESSAWLPVLQIDESALLHLCPHCIDFDRETLFDATGIRAMSGKSVIETTSYFRKWLQIHAQNAA